jgi:pyridoxal kinase
MKILSIQSAVAYGHVGNSAAVFPLQRIGVEVLPVYTVNFSNHTGYGAWRGPLISPDDVRDVITASRSAACSARSTSCSAAIRAARASRTSSSTRWRA